MTTNMLVLYLYNSTYPTFLSKTQSPDTPEGGWKATVARLMTECIAEAERRKTAFRAFSLQDCRPKGITKKMERGDADTIDAALHSGERMVRQVYDRRRVRVAKPAR